MSWDKYYEKNQGRPLRPLYLRAIEFLNPNAKLALDLGCGVGTEVADLLRRGLEVHAVDREPKSIELVWQNSPKTSKLHTHLVSLETWTSWPKVDFLFAVHSFPFCLKEGFHSVVEKAWASVNENGLIAVSFFGSEDDWVVAHQVVGVTAETVKKSLAEFEILHFEETRKKGATALQGEKLWHVIEVIARNEPNRKLSTDFKGT